jgi:hypothetical protein
MQRGASPAQHVVKGDVDTLTRETGQNCKDQHLPGSSTVNVRYTLIELSGKQKSDFLAAMNWPGLREHLEACTNDAGEVGPRMRRGLAAIEAANKPLRCLRIEDFGTRGLKGGDFDEKENFCLLCRAEFRTSNEGGRGGSYGLGKAVLWRFSSIATVLLSSLVNGSESKGIRIFGRTDIPSHTIKNNRQYESGGWFGARKTQPSDGSTFAESIFGDKKLPQALLLDRNYSPKTGTSALIVGFYEPDQDETRDLKQIAEDILESAARWFWPSMTGKNPAMEVEVSIEVNGKQTFTKKANPHPEWDPFIRAKDSPTTGATASTELEISETSIPFRVPARELPVAQAHPEITAELQLRVTRGDDSLAEHERANSVAVFRGAGMVVRYAPSKRKPLDNKPFFGVLYAGRAIGLGQDHSKAEEFFRASEPPLHDNWEYSEAVKHAYKTGAKLRLSNLWTTLQEKVFALIEENVVPEDRGPDMLAKLFPFGQSSKTTKKKHTVRTTILSSTYLGGQWKVKGAVKRGESNGKAWEARIGFLAATDSGAGEYLLVSSLQTSDKRAKLATAGPPATVDIQGTLDEFQFEAVLDPPASLRKKDLDLTAIRLSS